MENHNPAQLPRKQRLLQICVVTWAVIATLFTLYVFLPSIGSSDPSDPGSKHSQEPPASAKRNIIFMVSDGMGPASLVMARNFQQYVEGLDELDTLDIDEYFIGNSRTRSSSSLITDSAAGATAFSCGLKTYNGAIAVDPEQDPCGTLLEAAKLHGFKTGLVVTTRITDATPASFAAHAHYRSEEDFIAEQLVGIGHPFGAVSDLLIGGGRCHFHPRSKGGCRGDKVDLIADAQESGWQYVGNRKQFDALQKGANVTLPLLALLAEGDIPFDIDRHNEVHPSLDLSAETALNALDAATKDSDKGFFLMIEGSRIDHAGHQNDPVAQVREVIAFSNAFQKAVDYAANSDTETIVISTSDHETGGLAVARQLSNSYPEYLWHPKVLADAHHSTEFLARKLRAFKPRSSKNAQKELEQFVSHEILGPRGLNLTDISKKDVHLVLESKSNAQDLLALLVSRAAQIGWSTHGHSAVDVNVYGYARDMSVLAPIMGGNENIDLGHFMESFLGFDLEKTTRELRANWTYPPEVEDQLCTDDFHDGAVDESHEPHELHESSHESTHISANDLADAEAEEHVLAHDPADEQTYGSLFESFPDL